MYKLRDATRFVPAHVTAEEVVVLNLFLDRDKAGTVGAKSGVPIQRLPNELVRVTDLQSRIEEKVDNKLALWAVECEVNEVPPEGTIDVAFVNFLLKCIMQSLVIGVLISVSLGNHPIINKASPTLPVDNNLYNCVKKAMKTESMPVGKLKTKF